MFSNELFWRTVNEGANEVVKHLIACITCSHHQHGLPTGGAQVVVMGVLTGGVWGREGEGRDKRVRKEGDRKLDTQTIAEDGDMN